MNNGDMPAKGMASLELSQRFKEGYYDQGAIGLTKREHFAAMAMQGLVAKGFWGESDDDKAREAVAMADALLKALEE